jgi:Tol biopolymer transport system component
MRSLALIISIAAAASAAFAQASGPQVLEPGLISTAASEVKVTISPDGTRMLFGTIGWGMGGTGWDIYESIKTDGKWGAPQAVTFNSEANEFDPFFAPDGSGVYFFSNRLGGEGGDDIYFVPFDPATGGYAYPLNVGPEVNTSEDEWAPVVSFDGSMLLFSSNGRGGEGLHDLFIARREGDQWVGAKSLGRLVNGDADDFDAAFVVDDDTVVFASGDLTTKPNTKLFVTRRSEAAWSKPLQLGASVNCPGEGLTLGPSVSIADPVSFYFTSNCRDGAPGRMDIFRLTIDEALTLAE